MEVREILPAGGRFTRLEGKTGPPSNPRATAFNLSEEVRLKMGTRRTSFREPQLDGPMQPPRDPWLPDRSA